MNTFTSTAEPALPTEDETASLLRRLQNRDSTSRREALREVATLAVGRPSILHQVERMALDDPVDEVRRAAIDVLGSPVQLQTYGTMTNLTSHERAVVVTELRAWSAQGLIPPERADILGRRYAFDTAPQQPQAAPIKAPPATAIPAEPQPTPAPPPTPRPSLIQSLLSETSINVALYLGAFFVIGAALVLSALVEAARMPILAAVTAGFGVASLALESRLPRPSFVLFIVFSSLLLIDAGVIAGMLRLQGAAVAAFWGIVLGVTTVLWAFSTRHFASRLLSLAAFLSLEFSAVSFARLTATPGSMTLVLCSLAAVAGVLGAGALARWRGRAFAIPLFVLALATEALLLTAGFITIFAWLVSPAGPAPIDWVLLTAAWGIGAALFAASDRFFPFDLFPYAVCGALVPIVFLAVNAAAEPSSEAQWLANWAWGLAFVVSSELLRGSSNLQVKRYAAPALLASAAAFCLSLLLATVDAVEDGEATPVFIVLAGSAIAYGAAHWVRPKWYVWSAALSAGTAAWFAAFLLPFIQPLAVPFVDVMAGASLVLLGIDFALPRALEPAAVWRLPPRLLGGAMTCVTAFSAVVVAGSDAQTAVVFTAFAAFFMAYSLRFDPRVGYAATTASALAFASWAFALDRTLLAPVMTALSSAYFIGSLVLRSRDRRRWSDTLRFSGLVLGGLTALAILFTRPAGAGWYVLAIGLLFLLDLYLNDDRWAEYGVLTALTVAFCLFLYENHVASAAYYAAGAGILLLAMDLVFERRRTSHPRSGLIPQAIGGGAVAIAVGLVLAGDVPAGAAAWMSLSMAAFFGAMIYLRRDPRLGYILVGLVGLSAYFGLEVLNRTPWPWPLVILASVYYVAGSLVGGDWGRVLRNGAMGLGVLVSADAAVEGTALWASLPVAIAASLFAAEAVQRRNPWIALPADALYLAAYFMLLGKLQVDEPQFYTVAIAALGLLMHYLLLRAGSRDGAFVIGLTSQVVLLGTTYLQMVITSDPVYFTVLFLQSLAVLTYGVVIRSRSLVIAPIAFSILGVVTVVYGLLRGMSLVILIGCTGILLILLGSTALFLRERVGTLRRRLGEWNA